MEQAMHLLKKLTILLFLTGFFSSAYAALDSFEPAFCGVYSAEEGKGADEETKEGTKEEEEEPDCE
jgi:hypothetical protein